MVLSPINLTGTVCLLYILHTMYLVRSLRVFFPVVYRKIIIKQLYGTFLKLSLYYSDLKMDHNFVLHGFSLRIQYYESLRLKIRFGN